MAQQPSHFNVTDFVEYIKQNQIFTHSRRQETDWSSDQCGQQLDYFVSNRNWFCAVYVSGDSICIDYCDDRHRSLRSAPMELPLTATNDEIVAVIRGHPLW